MGTHVDAPVNRVDAWGLESGEANTFPFPLPLGDGAEKSSTGREDNPYCKAYPCDDQGTMQGDYKPIDGHKSVVLQWLHPLVDSFMVPYEHGAWPAQSDQNNKRH
jgi:hypothetical protein